MGVLDNIMNLNATPSENQGEQAEEDASGEKSGDEEAISQAVLLNQDLRKRQFNNLAQVSPNGQPATIALYQKVPEEVGEKVQLVSKPVKDRGVNIKEYRFFINNARYTKSEKLSVRQTFGESDEIAMGFGEQPKIWQFSGVLRKSNSRDIRGASWWEALERMYMNRLRATLLMQRNQFLRMIVDKMRMDGYLMNMTTTQQSRNSDVMAQFQMSMYVRSYRIAGGNEYIPASTILSSPPVSEGEEDKEPSEGFNAPEGTSDGTTTA